MKTKTTVYALLSATVVTAAILSYYFTFLHDPENIHPPLALEIPYDTLNFRAEKGFAYHHFTGSNIQIPENAFVDEDGYPVRGEVKMLYREFHAPEEILLSGIPMGNLDDSKNRALQSAGMFEMKAFKGDDELQLADGKKINLELAAFRTPDDYKTFLLDENFKWEEKGAPTLVANTQKQIDCAAIPALPDKPVDPGINANDRIIDIDADYYDQPHMVPFKKYRWKVAEHPANENLNDWVFRINWDHIKIETMDKEQNLFKLTFKSALQDYENKTVSKSCVVVVSPVLTGKDYENALAEFNASMAEYASILTQIEKEEARLALEADALNAFSINLMGVWNCDQYINNQQFVKINATFDFANEINPYVNKIKVYVINHTDNTVQDYTVRQWDNIYLRSGTATSLMAVLPDNKIAIYPQEEFTKVDFNDVYRKTRKYYFNTQSYSAQLEDKAKLKDLL